MTRSPPAAPFPYLLAEPQEAAFFLDYRAENGSGRGGTADYRRDMSGSITFTGAFGWNDADNMGAVGSPDGAHYWLMTA